MLQFKTHVKWNLSVAIGIIWPSTVMSKAEEFKRSELAMLLRV